MEFAGKSIYGPFLSLGLYFEIFVILYKKDKRYSTGMY